MTTASRKPSRRQHLMFNNGDNPDRTYRQTNAVGQRVHDTAYAAALMTLSAAGIGKETAEQAASTIAAKIQKGTATDDTQVTALATATARQVAEMGMV